jgi:rhodanese-related sulfurtransferase
MTDFKEIEANDLHSLMTDQRITLVDVRNDDEVARGIIPGALHVPLALLPVKHDNLHGDETLVFYCHSGIRSAQAAAFLAARGRDNVFNLIGGVLAWGKAGFPFERI